MYRAYSLQARVKSLKANKYIKRMQSVITLQQQQQQNENENKKREKKNM